MDLHGDRFKKDGPSQQQIRDGIQLSNPFDRKHSEDIFKWDPTLAVGKVSSNDAILLCNSLIFSEKYDTDELVKKINTITSNLNEDV